MATNREITAQSRKDEGKGASRRLRRAGQVPAVVYGADVAPQSIQLEHNSVLVAARHEWFFSSVLDLSVDGKKQKVLVRDLQKHPFKLQVLHIDFQRIDENAVIRIRVPLHFLNKEKSPAAKTSGVVISHNITEVEVACLPKNLPEFIGVDLAELKEGDIIHLSELQLPMGVEIPELKFGKEHDHPVVTAHTMKEEVEEAPAPAEGEAAAAAAAAAAPAKAAPAKEEKK
ncbi:MAG: 50S ribosomal protein L25/general stress protein Ctc [Mizugakiibacter sp.]|uniref:50S ribosomal protein L25/general stress protein Ctc n=1 Tax=Mizugakiibacter sp. TaxID=1972610 RepID=UPI0031C1DB57|nr:50S ribosomal protein L25/general stress protein Ctc [Xanthomonadaceae bacterium]